MQQLAATISPKITDNINLLLAQAIFIEKSDFSFRSLNKEISKLMGSDPFQANISKGHLYSLTGDLESSMYHFDIAEKLANNDTVKNERAIALNNLGYYSEAQKWFRVSSSPENGLFYHNSSLGLYMLAFDTLDKMFHKAQKMNLDFSNIDLDTHKKILSILDAAHINESDLAKIADITGEVLRENNLMACNMPLYDVETDPLEIPCVYVTFLVNATHELAAKMYDEFIHRLLQSSLAISPSVHFSFRSIQ